jgi:hypothetical protein
MNYKTMMMCAVIGTLMLNAWGMEQEWNGNNNPIVKPESSEIAQLKKEVAELQQKVKTADIQLMAVEVRCQEGLDRAHVYIENLQRVVLSMHDKLHPGESSDEVKKALGLKD